MFPIRSPQRYHVLAYFANVRPQDILVLLALNCWWIYGSEVNLFCQHLPDVAQAGEDFFAVVDLVVPEKVDDALVVDGVKVCEIGEIKEKCNERFFEGEVAIVSAVGRNG